MTIRRSVFTALSAALVVLTACGRDISAPSLHSTRVAPSKLATGSWAERAAAPEARNARGGASAAGRFFVFGGHTDGPDCTFTKAALAYDPSADEWTYVQPMFTSRAVAAAVELNGSIHVLGGATSCGGYTGANEVYSPTTNNWTIDASMTPRYGVFAATVGGKIYAIGGHASSGMLGLVEAFDPATHTWTTKAPMPTPRGQGAVAALNGKIYTIGGCCGEVAAVTIEAYNPATNTWTQKNTLPFQQGSAVAAVVNGTLYIFGANLHGDAVMRYDPSSDSWSEDAPMPVPLQGNAGAVIGGTFYTTGGHNNGVHQNRTWAFTASTVDATPPTITVPANIVANAIDASGATVTYSVTTTDNVGVVSESCSPASATTFAIGTTTVQCTASDAAGNTADANFTVTVSDVASPSFAALPDLTANATGPSGVVVTFSAVASDNVGVSSQSCAPASGSTFAIGATTVQCTASDAAGNTADASFTVTVRDGEAPHFGFLSDLTLNAAGPAGVGVNYSVTPSDNVGVTSQSCTPASGSMFAIGLTDVSCTASDAAGNISSASFTVTVKGASAQMTELSLTIGDRVFHEGTATSLQAKLAAAVQSFGEGNLMAACGQLEAMINQITAQSGKKISAFDAALLNAEIDRIRAVIGC